MKQWHRFSKEQLLVVVIILLATVLRFINLSWDGGHNIHPDEALIVNGALAIRFFTNLHPGFHDYNGFPVYVLRLAAHVVSWATGDGSYLTVPAAMTYLGRMITATLSTLTVVVVYVLGKRLWGATVGLLAAALLAPLPLAVQLAHFYTSDTFVVFFLSLLSLAVVGYWQHPARRNVLHCALWAGFALACKNTAYLLMFLPVAAVLTRKGALRERAGDLVLLGAGAAGVFFLASPYSLLDWTEYIARSRYLAEVVAGRLQFDWTTQFLETTPLFWVRNSLYAFGPAVVTLGILGVLRAALMERGPKRTLALWGVVFGVFLASVYLKFIRYLLPLAPVFTLYAASLVVVLHKRMHWLGKTVGATAVVLTWGWGILFVTIYTAPHPIVKAAFWIAAEAVGGSRIVREEGNELLRFSHVPLSSKTYNVSLIRPYALPDTQEKAEGMLIQISQAQYVLVESDKVENTVTRLAGYYPYTSRVYERLEDGGLGYRLAAEFSSFPRIRSLVFKDVGAEETFWVFDHPRVRIYQNQEQLSSQELLHRLEGSLKIK